MPPQHEAKRLVGTELSRCSGVKTCNFTELRCITELRWNYGNYGNYGDTSFCLNYGNYGGNYGDTSLLITVNYGDTSLYCNYGDTSLY